MEIGQNAVYFQVRIYILGWHFPIGLYGSCKMVSIVHPFIVECPRINRELQELKGNDSDEEESDETVQYQLFATKQF
jgi:hypothetical protein